ncbi:MULTISPECIES: hypothetical protein [Shouchella]|uniref:Uncharacterized protein n=2 Tax=Shouchella TaxID=2893057 RepID=A0ABY7W5S8_9BACI|nr:MULTISPECIES: hypothetical protein [Shouchella]MED4130427.1 hypothetical protein [Shouchella miscanthi]WDF04310.1 hypothetical protein PQ477_02185 [Shouchella hunanensis]GAF23707.1 hypothetical protein JCM19047_3547 [Bacillus sp. JCM 19047]
MVDAIVLALAVFFGWLILDVVKTKKLTGEVIIQAGFVGVVAGVLWYGIGVLLG